MIEKGSEESFLEGSKTLGAGLREMACAPDGVTEAFYDEHYDPEQGRYVVGLQFHPERMLEDYPGCKRASESGIMIILILH